MIYTIGYSNRSLPEFIQELERRKITTLLDVRSSPFSRNTVFNAPQIERWAPMAGMYYRQAGDILGGRANLSLDDPRYLAALDLLLSSASREPFVIMCAEGDPTQCHRTWDVGASLLVRYGVVVRSILRDGREEDITQTINRIPPSRFQPEIFKRLASQPKLL